MRKYLILAIGLCCSSVSNAAALDYGVNESNKFYTSEGVIPDGCLGQLKAEYNGDDTVAAIFVNQTSMRGCIAANIPYPGGDDDKIRYEINKALGSDTFNIKVCERAGGSMSEYCEQVVVRFRNYEYRSPDNTKSVLVLEKVGEW